MVAVALAAARQLGSLVLACPSTGNLANAVAAAGKGRHPLGRLHPVRPRAAEDRHDRGLRRTLVAVDGTYDDVNRLAREMAGDMRRWAFVNVNVRPYYAEGSKTLGYEVAEQLGWRLPSRWSSRSPAAQLTKVDKAFRELAARPGGRRRPTDLRRAGRRLLTSSTAFKAGSDVVRPVRPTPSPSRWRSATPPTGLRARRRPAHRRSGRGCLRRRGRRRHPAAGPDRGHLRRDCRRGNRRRLASCSRPGSSTLSGDGRVQHRRRPEDAGRHASAVGPVARSAPTTSR